jgi:heme-degrading monooxygenase HmoA
MAYAVIRHYKGSTELIDELGRRPGEVESLIRGVPGFQNYYLVRSDGGGFSVSVFEDRAGAEESVKAARQYIQDNIANLAGEPPEVIQGEVIISFTGQG